MKKYNKLMALLLVSVFFGSFAYAASDSGDSLKAAPGFQLKGLDDKVVSSADYFGKKPVILVFWTTWCPYCRQQLSQLNARLAELTKKGIQVLAINVGEPKSKVVNFAKSYSLNLQILLDELSAVAETYELMGVPTYFVIDVSGKVAAAANQFPEDAISKLAVK
jgi:peroxiredoxin